MLRSTNGKTSPSLNGITLEMQSNGSKDFGVPSYMSSGTKKVRKVSDEGAVSLLSCGYNRDEASVMQTPLKCTSGTSCATVPVDSSALSYFLSRVETTLAKYRKQLKLFSLLMIIFVGFAAVTSCMKAQHLPSITVLYDLDILQKDPSVQKEIKREEELLFNFLLNRNKLSYLSAREAQCMEQIADFMVKNPDVIGNLRIREGLHVDKVFPPEYDPALGYEYVAGMLEEDVEGEEESMGEGGAKTAEALHGANWVLSSQEKKELLAERLASSAKQATTEEPLLEPPRSPIPDWKYLRERKGFHHLDIRFGNLKQYYHRRDTFKIELWKNWAAFAEENGLRYWISHGALIGWFWNRRLLPWDDDVDIQMTEHELKTSLTELNYTIYEDRYLLDVNPNSAYRLPQVHNVIDARFIDMASGMFIDITGLADTGRLDGKISCKRPHHYRPHDLFPLVSTTFEGVKTWRPRNVMKILCEEYTTQSFTKDKFKGYTFNKRKNLWVRDRPFRARSGAKSG